METEENREENRCFGQMCRACMSKEQRFYSLLEFTDQHRIFEMLATTTPLLVIKIRDELPQEICAVCLNKLNIAYHFQQMCIASDKKMQTMLSEMKQQKPGEECVPLVGQQLQTSANMQISEKDNSKNTAVIEIDDDQDNYRNASDTEWSESEENDLEDTRLPKASATDGDNAEANIDDINNKSQAETNVDDIEKPDERNRRNAHHPCTECGKDFDRPYRLRRHIGVHSASRAYACDICKYRFTTLKHLTSHQTTHNTETTTKKPPPTEGYKCPECPRRFAKRESLSAHIQYHRKANPEQTFQCEECVKKFKKFTLLSKHMHRVHPEQAASHLKQLNMNESLKKFACIYCDEEFLQNAALKKHLRTHTGEKPFLCSQCGKSFQNGSNMRQHLLRHSGERRYQCPQCPSKFACQSDQIKHMSIHRDTKPHVCDICGSGFSRSYTLKKHKYIHTGERPHKCEECDMTFVFIDHMRRHMRTHTGEKPYKCKFCDRAYAESGDLNKHLRTHYNSEKTYICTQCPSAFKYQSELRKHQIEHYKAKVQEADYGTTTQTATKDLGI